MNLQNLTTIPLHVFCFNPAINIFSELLKMYPAIFLPQGSPKFNSIISWKHKIKPMTCVSFMLWRTQTKVRYQSCPSFTFIEVCHYCRWSGSISVFARLKSGMVPRLKITIYWNTTEFKFYKTVVILCLYNTHIICYSKYRRGTWWEESYC